MGEDQNLPQPSPPAQTAAEPEVYMTKKPFINLLNIKQPVILLVLFLLIGGVTLIGGYQYGTLNSKAAVAKLEANFSTLEKKTAAEQPYVKYLMQPEKDWKDLITHSSAVYYILGIVEKNLPATRPADVGLSTLRGRELTVMGSEGSTMVFFVNEGSATIKIGVPRFPDTLQPYSLSKIEKGDKVTAIVTAPVFQKIEEVTDTKSLNLRSEWVIKLNEEISPAPSR